MVLVMDFCGDARFSKVVPDWAIFRCGLLREVMDYAFDGKDPAGRIVHVSRPGNPSQDGEFTISILKALQYRTDDH